MQYSLNKSPIGSQIRNKNIFDVNRVQKRNWSKSSRISQTGTWSCNEKVNYSTVFNGWI